MGSPLSGETGHYRLDRVLSQFSPKMYSPVDYLPYTRFPTRGNENDYLKEAAVEKEKERGVILSQPYRTTQLILPSAKTNPNMINNKIVIGGKPNIQRSIDEKNILKTLTPNQALVNRQVNSPRALYSNQNFNDAVYIQTGVELQQPQPHRIPCEFNPEKSYAYQALMEEEGHGAGGVVQPAAVVVQQAAPMRRPPQQGGRPSGQERVNSIGQPVQRIAQSDSFRRLMINVLGE